MRASDCRSHCRNHTVLRGAWPGGGAVLMRPGRGELRELTEYLARTGFPEIAVPRATADLVDVAATAAPGCRSAGRSRETRARSAGHDHSSPRGRRSAWTVRVAGFRIPKAVMIDSRLGPDVQMVSAASTVGVRSSADMAAPARRPPGRGRACGRVGEASASRQLRLGLPGALVG